MAELKNILSNIANAIRDKNGENVKYKADQFDSKINNINLNKNITANKTLKGIYKTSSNPENLSDTKRYIGAASTNKHAIFACGWNGSYILSVDAYDGLILTKTRLEDFDKGITNSVGISFNGTALFAGGTIPSLNSTIYAVNDSLVKSAPANLSIARTLSSGTNNDIYFLIGGGNGGSANGIVATVDAYTKSYTRSNPTPLSNVVNMNAACRLNTNMLFGGGTNNTVGYTSVDNYNSSLVRSTLTPLSFAKTRFFSTNVGTKYGLFGPGRDATTSIYSNDIDVYNSSLVKVDNIKSSLNGFWNTASSIDSFSDNYALFGGGYSVAPSSYTGIVDVFNSQLVRSNPYSLTTPASELGSTTIGNYVLFAGGTIGSSYSKEVNAYRVI